LPVFWIGGATDPWSEAAWSGLTPWRLPRRSGTCCPGASVQPHRCQTGRWRAGNAPPVGRAIIAPVPAACPAQQ